MMDKMGVKPTLFLLFVMMATMFSRAASAQVVTAAISGKVEDSSGAGVSGATVSVKSLETGATRVATTDEAGDYKVLSLPLGAQEVKVEKQGFTSQVRTGIRLEVGQQAVVNLRLQVGDFVQQVTVSEEVPVVNTTTASVSGVVGERAVKDLPLNGRSFDNLITLNPGAINYSSEKSLNTSTSNGNTFTVAGRRPSDKRGTAGHRRHPRIQRPYRHVSGGVRQAGRRAGDGGDAIGNQRPAWCAVRISA